MVGFWSDCGCELRFAEMIRLDSRDIEAELTCSIKLVDEEDQLLRCCKLWWGEVEGDEGVDEKGLGNNKESHAGGESERPEEQI